MIMAYLSISLTVVRLRSTIFTSLFWLSAILWWNIALKTGDLDTNIIYYNTGYPNKQETWIQT